MTSSKALKSEQRPTGEQAVGTATCPIKIGILLDTVFPSPPPPPWNCRQDFLDAVHVTFEDAQCSGKIDRPVELILEEVEGLPRGSVKAVADAYKRLVEAGCLAIIGPAISDNAVPLSEYVNEHGKVPTLTWAGTDDWLGEWTFSLGNGSQPDEPVILANIMAHADINSVVVIAEHGLVGDQYLSYVNEAFEHEGLTSAGVVRVSAIVGSDLKFEAQKLAAQLKPLKENGADALLFLGFGYGCFVVNLALELLQWQPTKYTTTAWEVGFMHPDILKAYYGWIGLEQYDAENPVTTAFLDRFEKRYGRRPEYFMPGYGHDMANVIVHALSKASPLSPRGVKNSLERIRLLPSASGAPGTRISFGKFTRRGWMGAGYLVAREFNANNPGDTIFRGRIQAPVKR